MTDPFIIPPSELIDSWNDNIDSSYEEDIVKAAKWGADRELDACCAWISSMFGGHKTWPDQLRAARRPKSTSLKEQALNQLRALNQEGVLDSNTYLIRRALETLSDD